MTAQHVVADVISVAPTTSMTATTILVTWVATVVKQLSEQHPIAQVAVIAVRRRQTQQLLARAVVAISIAIADTTNVRIHAVK